MKRRRSVYYSWPFSMPQKLANIGYHYNDKYNKYDKCCSNKPGLLHCRQGHQGWQNTTLFRWLDWVGCTGRLCNHGSRNVRRGYRCVDGWQGGKAIVWIAGWARDNATWAGYKGTCNHINRYDCIGTRTVVGNAHRNCKRADRIGRECYRVMRRRINRSANPIYNTPKIRKGNGIG